MKNSYPSLRLLLPLVLVAFVLYPSSPGLAQDDVITPPSTPVVAPDLAIDESPASSQLTIITKGDEDAESETQAKAVITKRDGSALPKEAPYGVTVGFSVMKKSNFDYLGEGDNRKASVKWAIEIHPSWLRDWVEVVDDGASILIPTGTPQYGVEYIRVTAAVAKLNGTIDMQEIRISVKDPTAPNPSPDDTPKPKPEPEVDPSANLTGFQKVVYGMILKFTPMNSDARRLAAAGMSNNFGTIATKISGAVAGDPDVAKFKDVDFLINETRTLNDASQAGDKAWKSFFNSTDGSDCLAKRLDALLPAGSPAGEYIGVWKDLHVAFDAASRTKGAK